MRALVFFAALGTVALAACGGGNGPTYVGPTPGPTCGPTGIQSQLIYPAAGSSGVSDSLAEIVVAVSTPLPINTYDLALIALNNGGGTAFTYNYLSQINSSQLPSGSGSTTIANPTYEEVNLVSTLPTATQIQVALNNVYDPNNCTPLNVPGGTFTTK